MSSHDLREPVGIRPQVDCVFRTILGVPERVGVLRSFLEAVLPHRAPITDVEVLNPVPLSEVLGGKSPELDVRARDGEGRWFHADMQMFNHTGLKPRMLYGWSAQYKSQLAEGEHYKTLQPVISIWLLDQNILRNATRSHHRFELRDPRRAEPLTDHLELHVIELPRWRAGLRDKEITGMEGWIAFFAEAQDWAEVPERFESPEIRTAFKVLEDFKMNERYNAAYESRMDAIRLQKTIEAGRDEAVAERDEAVALRDEAVARLKAAEAGFEAERQRIAAEHQRIVAERQRIAAERDQLREQLAALQRERAGE